MVRIMAPWEAELAARDDTLTQHQWARARRQKSEPQTSGTSYGDGWRRRGSDMELLAFLSRFTVISVRQAARFFYGGSWETCRQRVRWMSEAGLIERDHSTPWAGPVIWPTLEGQRLILGRDHPLATAVRPKDSQMLHRLMVSEQAAALVTSGREVFSEREIRMFELRGPDELGQWLEDRGVKAGDGVVPGVVPTVYDESVDGSEMFVSRQRWLACVTMPAGSTRRVMRYPDLIEVTDDGELCAIEVELADKEMARLRGYVEGYRDSGPYLVSEDGKQQVRYRRYVRWLCSPSVQRQLIGHKNGVNPLTGKPALGVIRDVYGAQSNPYVGDTSNVYVRRVRNKSTGNVESRMVEFDADGLAPGRPMSAQLLPMPDDEGMQWRLTQLFMPDRMYCELSEWGRWKQVWLGDLQQRGFDPTDVPFHMWVTVSNNYERCTALTR